MSYTFIDLFAGIGGFHIALSSLGAKCVLTCEIDKYAKKTYLANLTTEKFHDDVLTLESKDIPDFDILCAGFPCQPFSHAGRQLGFNDTRGTMFFELARILKDKQPKAFIFENVRGLLTHDNGKTFETIKNTILELGYSFHYDILISSDFGVPQMRKRIYMVGFKDKNIIYTSPKELKIPLTLTMSDILGGQCDVKIGKTIRLGGRGAPIGDRHNWDSYKVNGAWVRLNSEHAKRLQGFPEDFKLPVSETQAIKQLGNAISVPVAKAVAQQVIKALDFY